MPQQLPKTTQGFVMPGRPVPVPQGSAPSGPVVSWGAFLRRAPLYWVMILIDAMLTLPPLFGFQAACDAARTHFFGEDAVLPWEH